jgi:hypothetical protein
MKYAFQLQTCSGHRALSDQMHITMARYQQLQYSPQPLRSFSVMMQVGAIREIAGRWLEQLFFKDSIGAVPMCRLVADLYRSSSASSIQLPTSSSASSSSSS